MQTGVGMVDAQGQEEVVEENGWQGRWRIVDGDYKKLCCWGKVSNPL